LPTRAGRTPGTPTSVCKVKLQSNLVLVCALPVTNSSYLQTALCKCHKMCTCWVNNKNQGTCRLAVWACSACHLAVWARSACHLAVWACGACHLAVWACRACYLAVWACDKNQGHPKQPSPSCRTPRPPLQCVSVSVVCVNVCM